MSDYPTGSLTRRALDTWTYRRDRREERLAEWRETPGRVRINWEAVEQWLPPRRQDGGEVWTGRLYSPDWYPDTPPIYPESDDTAP